MFGRISAKRGGRREEGFVVPYSFVHSKVILVCIGINGMWKKGMEIVREIR